MSIIFLLLVLLPVLLLYCHSSNWYNYSRAGEIGGGGAAAVAVAVGIADAGAGAGGDAGGATWNRARAAGSNRRAYSRVGGPIHPAQGAGGRPLRQRRKAQHRSGH